MVISCERVAELMVTFQEASKVFRKLVFVFSKSTGCETERKVKLFFPPAARDWHHASGEALKIGCGS